MTLFDLIYYFFYSQVFPVSGYLDSISYQMGLEEDQIYLTLAEYLSLLASIISMVVILVLCCALIRKIYNMCAHIIG